MDGGGEEGEVARMLRSPTVVVGDGEVAESAFIEPRGGEEQQPARFTIDLDVSPTPHRHYSVRLVWYHFTIKIRHFACFVHIHATLCSCYVVPLHNSMSKVS